MTKYLAADIIQLVVLWLVTRNTFATVSTPHTASGHCTQILDHITSSFDYTSRDGEVIGYISAGTLKLQCIPEDGGNYSSNTTCQWLANGSDFGEMQFNPSVVPVINGCALRYELHALSFGLHSTNGMSKDGYQYMNYTCITNNEAREMETSMSYIIFFNGENQAIGIEPSSQENDTLYTDEDSTITLNCDVDAGKASAVLTLDWYHKEPNGTLRDVNSMENHAITTCTSTPDGWVKSSLAIQHITADLLETDYICAARKYDIKPYTSSKGFDDQYLHSKPLSATTDSRKVAITKPSLDTVVFLNSSNACTLEGPCTSLKVFTIAKNPVTIVSYALLLGLSITGGVVLIIIIASIVCYYRRALILSCLKHKWGITKDLEDSQCDYHTVVFYSNKTPSEEYFVQNELLVYLENKWRYKTCVPQRDFLIGTDRAGVCVDALATSQRAIFVLTEDMFLEEWNLYCLDVALQEHRKIVIIKRQEIDFDKLFNELGSKYSEVDSALRVASVVDWPRDKFKWAWLHYRLPAIKRRMKTRQLSNVFKNEQETRVRSWSKSKLEEDAVDNVAYVSNNTIDVIVE